MWGRGRREGRKNRREEGKEGWIRVREEDRDGSRIEKGKKNGG